ncbi:MAG TPA: DUF748 domain-containing protein, partial [Polyangiales bacterium]|nr:DUF748 domain-containing protein [Polyangiales bacterium]
TYANKTLQGLDGFSGHVADIDLAVWRGAYVIKGVDIKKTTDKEPVPFVSVDRVDISVHWNALLHGNIVAEIELLAPKLNMVAEKKQPNKAEDAVQKREGDRLAKGQETTWQTQVKQLVPLQINRIGVQEGEIHFRDPYAKPKVDVEVTHIVGEVTNLTNSEDLSEDMVARASIEAVALHSGTLKVKGNMDPYAEKPTFHLQASAERLALKELNDFLKAYANVDAEKGTLSVYTEVDCEKGHFKGYVKPLIRDLEVLRWKDEQEGFFGKLWEGVVEVGKDILENDEKKQVATRVPLSGNIDNPDADIIQTVFYVLYNGFIEALKRGLEPSIGDMQVAREQKK